MVLWAILWITAGLTAFYSFRLVMKIFFGEQNYSNEEHHPHEAKNFVIAAMIPLAILAVIAGWFEHSFVEFVTKVFQHGKLQILIIQHLDFNFKLQVLLLYLEFVAVI